MDAWPGSLEPHEDSLSRLIEATHDGSISGTEVVSARTPEEANRHACGGATELLSPRPDSHLTTFAGVLPADGYAGATGCAI